MRGTIGIGLTLAAVLGAVSPAFGQDWDTMPYTNHEVFQAVDADGFATFPVFASGPVRMRGILLNLPESMLDTSAGAPGTLGGQWQVFVQAVDLPDTGDDDGTFGGTACWMGQLYGNLPWIGDPSYNYTNDQWDTEVFRVNHDPDTLLRLRPGDLVEIRARGPGLPFGGKTNVNEQHNNDPSKDFDLVLLDRGHGLPSATPITLADVKDASNDFIFDSTRTTGAERYQGELVLLQNVVITDPGNWGPNQYVTVQEAGGGSRTLPVHLGYDASFSAYPAPTGTIEVLGIFNQEDDDQGDGYKDGYEVWAMGYDGSDFIIPDEVQPRLVAARSVRTHGGVSHALPLVLDPPEQATVEPRLGGPTRVELDFDVEVQAADCSALNVTGASCISVAGSGTTTLEVQLAPHIPAPPDSPSVCVSIDLVSVVGWDGGLPMAGDTDVHVTARQGDVNQSGFVDINDLSAVKSELFQTPDDTNFLADVEPDGFVDINDLSRTKSALFDDGGTCP